MRFGRNDFEKLMCTITRGDVVSLADSFYNILDDGTVVSLVDGATISWNINNGWNSKVTLSGNRTLSISNAITGQCYNLAVTQDSVGSRTLILPANSKVANGGAGSITLTTNSGATDILSCYYDGTNYFWTIGLNFT